MRKRLRWLYEKFLSLFVSKYLEDKKKQKLTNDIIIPFNKPFLTGKETHYMYMAVYKEAKISGNGKYTQLCHDFFKKRYNFPQVLLTTSCTDALEMSGLLLDIKPGDEIIIPSFTFVSTANAFVLRGAKIVFADSYKNHPNIDANKIEELITEKTKAIVPVHYGGIACDMDKILKIAKKYNLYVVEDAAQAIESFYKGKPLGSFGDMAAFSFHETKNIIAGEGGLLVVNNTKFSQRAEIIWEKGTNRAAFFRGEVKKYNWVDIGSSYLPSEIIAAFLYAQLEELDKIQNRRIKLWERYYHNLKPLENKGFIKLPIIPEYASNNGHIFYITTENQTIRDALIAYLKKQGILAVFHYLPLHLSPFYRNKHDNRELPNAVRFSQTIIRLPMFYELTFDEIDFICEKIYNFFN